jgi:mono/diheme cytochrome c family protein
MQKLPTVVMALIAAGSLQAAGADLSKLPPAAAQKGVTFTKDIRPLFEASCAGCHGERQQKGGLRLDSLEAVLKGSEHSKVVVAGKIKESPLLIAVSGLDPEMTMPPKMRPGRGGPGGPGGPRPGFAPPKPLTAQEVGLIRAWIEQGVK